MLKSAVFPLFILLCFMSPSMPARAELPEKGQSSEQTLIYDNTKKSGAGQEIPQPYISGIEEYPYTGPDPVLREKAADDADFQSYPYPDYPADDPGVKEVPMTDSAGPDTTLKETPMTDSAGPDTTLREKAADDSGMQEYADPYGPAPDLFGPKKNVGSGA
jgi:hypothetical protein